MNYEMEGDTVLHILLLQIINNQFGEGTRKPQPREQDNRNTMSTPAKIKYEQQMTRLGLENTSCSSTPQEDQLPRGDLYAL